MKNPADIAAIGQALDEINAVMNTHGVELWWLYQDTWEMRVVDGDALKVELEDGKIGVSDF
jgi:predicted metal-dependent peptidase